MDNSIPMPNPNDVPAMIKIIGTSLVVVVKATSVTPHFIHI